MRLYAALFIALSVSAAACHSNATTTSASRPAAASNQPLRSHVGIVTRDGSRYAVNVELATNEDERRQGLMFREKLGNDDGMLFIFERESPLSFWMHNTLIPLDMIFIRTDGRIVGIVENATPRTDTPRSVDRPSRYVLEVNGGWAQAHGVRTGDEVQLGDALAAARAHEESP